MIEMYHFENDYLFCHKGVTISTGRLRLKNFGQNCIVKWLGSSFDHYQKSLKSMQARRNILQITNKGIT